MKREVSLGDAAVFTLVIGLGIAMNILTACSGTGTEPAPGSSNSVGASRSEPSPAASAAGAAAKTTEADPHPPATNTPQQVTRAAASPTPARAQEAPAAPVVADKFSGTWVLDRARSEGLVPGMNQVMSVTRAGDTMNVTTKLSVAEKGEWTVNDTYVLNGRETEFTADMTGGGASKGKRIARLTDYGLEANEDSTIKAQGTAMKVNITRKWRLSDDKSLIIEMTVNGPQGIQKNKRVFIRK